MELCCTRTSVSEHISRQIVSCLLSLKSTLCRANGTTILEEWDNGKRVEAKKETITNEEEEEVQEQRRPEPTAAAEIASTAAPLLSGESQQQNGQIESQQQQNGQIESQQQQQHGHIESHDHELDADLGDLPTLWYGETHQIQPDNALTPSQGMFSSAVAMKIYNWLNLLSQSIKVLILTVN